MESPLLAEHWREMAEDIRAKAKSRHDGEPRRTMLKVAKGYENMAKRIETLGVNRRSPARRAFPSLAVQPSRHSDPGERERRRPHVSARTRDQQPRS